MKSDEPSLVRMKRQSVDLWNLIDGSKGVCCNLTVLYWSQVDILRSICESPDVEEASHEGQMKTVQQIKYNKERKSTDSWSASACQAQELNAESKVQLDFGIRPMSAQNEREGITCPLWTPLLYITFTVYLSGELDWSVGHWPVAFKRSLSKWKVRLNGWNVYVLDI